MVRKKFTMEEHEERMRAILNHMPVLPQRIPFVDKLREVVRRQRFKQIGQDERNKIS